MKQQDNPRLPTQLHGMGPFLSQGERSWRIAAATGGGQILRHAFCWLW